MTGRVHVSRLEHLSVSYAAGWSKLDGNNMQGIPQADFQASPERAHCAGWYISCYEQDQGRRGFE
jgi:hypothetical protein